MKNFLFDYNMYIYMLTICLINAVNNDSGYSKILCAFLLKSYLMRCCECVIAQNE